MRKLLLALLFISCSEIEEVKKQVSEISGNHSSRTAEVCEEISASNGLSIEDCNIVWGGSNLTQDVIIGSPGKKVEFNFDTPSATAQLRVNDNGLNYFSSALPSYNTATLSVFPDIMELGLYQSELSFLLQASKWTVTGLTTTPSADAVSNVGSILRLGTIKPLTDSGVRSGSYSGGSGTSFVVSLGVTSPVSTYKVSITPTSTGASAQHYISAKTGTNFTVTYLSSATDVTFDWIATP